MITNNNEIKTCANCKHFDRYYVKTDIEYRPLILGICRRKVPHTKRVRQAETHADEICELWSYDDKTEKEQTILKTLQKMSAQLEELTFILKDDL